MSRSLPSSAIAEEALPITPDVESWRAMSPAAREAFLEDALAALQREAELMPEGGPHIRAKFRLRETLRGFYERVGRAVYLGSELPVHYPAEAPIAPDLIAVLDVEDPGDTDWRMAWVVADEGKGVDLALEIQHHGNRRKDLVDNVIRYARLGISEYFIYDMLKMRAIGYRLSSTGRYDPIASKAGMLHSQVLGLDLAITDGHLRFFHAGAEVPQTREILARVSAMVEDLEQRVEAEARRAEDEARRAQDATRRAEEAEQRAMAEAAARAELERQLAELRAKLGQG